MEALIAMLVLAVLAAPVMLIVALVMIGDLKQRVRALEQAQARPAPAPAPQAVPQPPSQERTAGHGTTAAATRAHAASATRPIPGTGAPRAAPAAAAPTAAVTHSAPAPPARPLPSSAGEGDEGPVVQALRWFAGGNAIAKVGMLVLLAGVAALLKYASDQGWLSVPAGWRLAGIAAAALVGLGFGWLQRTRRRTFALVLQGGAIGVLLLVVFAALRLYGLIPVLPAFALSVLLVAALCALAVLQDARTLAIFGILAGFLAPVWLSTGEGSHVVLFSYYALLNLGVLAMAWRRAWRELNLVGFAFTWGIGVAWGVLRYDPAEYATVQPFLLLFFAFYLAIPLLYLRRRPGHGYDRVDGALVFGTPLVAFPLQALLLDGERWPLALCALALAALYALLAWRLLPRARFRAIGVAFAVLATGFATLAVPLAFSARVTACLFALEGAALIWLGLRQSRLLPRAAGLALQVLAALAYLFVLDVRTEADWILLNPAWLAALLIAVAGFAGAWAYRQAGHGAMAGAAYLWGLAWWSLAALAEIDRHLPPQWHGHAWLVLAVTGAWLAAEAGRLWPAPLLGLTVAGGMGLACLAVLSLADGVGHPFAAAGLWAWAAFALLGTRALWCLRTSADAAALAAQCLWWLAWPLAVSLSAWHLAGEAGLAPAWRWAAGVVPWGLAALVAVLRWRWLAWPLGPGFDAARPLLQPALLLAAGGWWLAGLSMAGDAALPGPWLPLANPLDAVQAGLWLLAAWWLLRSGQAPAPLAPASRGLAGAALLALLSVMVLRAVHHWTGVEWSGALWTHGAAQAGLSVLWSAMGVTAWIAGSRCGDRGPWLAGAVLMGVVLAKLVLVDRQFLGNLPGILSFIAYGLLCMVVGYFAPAPPRRADGEGVPVTARDAAG